MKKCKLFFIGLLMSLPFVSIQAQEVIFHEGFEDHLPGCLEFIDDCIPGWINTHGTANVWGSPAGWLPGPSYMGIKHAHIYVTKFDPCLPNFPSDQGEGMALEFEFDPNETYRISYALRGVDVQEITWYLTNGLVPNGGLPTSQCTDPGTVVPPIPTGSQAITPSIIDFENICCWETFQTNWFTPNADFSQLWFRGTNINIPGGILTGHINLDEVIIERLVGCGFDCPKAIVDFNACIDEDNMGSIAFDCEASYQWDIPQGSTAIEFTTSTHSALLQASPGNYSVTITNSEGCSDVQTFEIESACCDSLGSCAAPEKSICDYNPAGVSLEWSDVTGISDYLLTITTNDDDCGCGTGGGTNTQTQIVTGTSYLIPNPIPFCFSWSVQSICIDQGNSASTEVLCFDGSQDCFLKNPFRNEESSDRSNLDLEVPLLAKIYPNPVIDEFNFAIEITEETMLMIDIYDINGKRIWSDVEGNVKPGFYQKSWTPERSLSSGIYLVHFQTNTNNATQTILIENNN